MSSLKKLSFLLSTLCSVAQLVSCSGSIEACGLTFPDEDAHLYANKFKEINARFEKSNFGNNFAAYDELATRWLEELMAKPDSWFNSREKLVGALRLYLATSQLESRDCDDCAYLVAKGNCESAAFWLRGCFPYEEPGNILSKIIRYRVAKLAKRCEPTYAQKFRQELEKLHPDTIAKVFTIGERVAGANLGEDYTSVDEMLQKAQDPYYAAIIYGSSSRASLGLLVDIMRHLDELGSSRFESMADDQNKKADSGTVRTAYKRILQDPCKEYLEYVQVGVFQPAGFYRSLKKKILHEGLEPPESKERTQRLDYYTGLVAYDACLHIANNDKSKDLAKLVNQVHVLERL